MKPGRQKITVFDRATGRIRRGRQIDFGRQPIVLSQDEDWAPGRHVAGQVRIDPDTGRAVPLPDFAPVVEVNHIRDLPEGAKAVYKNERQFAGSDGVVRFDVKYPEVLRVTLTHPLYRAMEGLDVPCDPAANTGAPTVPQRYDRLRMAAYPPLEDLADALVKQDPEALEAYRQRCLDVKARIPKPERGEK